MKTVTETLLLTQEAAIFIVLVEYLSLPQCLSSVSEIEGVIREGSWQCSHRHSQTATLRSEQCAWNPLTMGKAFHPSVRFWIVVLTEASHGGKTSLYPTLMSVPGRPKCCPFQEGSCPMPSPASGRLVDTLTNGAGWGWVVSAAGRWHSAGHPW